jgi:hypothetical protein
MRLSLVSGFMLLSTALAASPARAGETAEPFTASRDQATFERSLQCLTEALYYEARSESDDGQRAVAQVVLNRVRHPSYPSTVCGVVYQGSARTTGCQFSFTCTGVMGPIGEPAAWDRARRIAAAALRGSVYRPVGLAVNYHTTAIRPYWAPSLVRQTVVGAHIFYTRPDSRTVQAFSQIPDSFEPTTFGRLRPERFEDVRVEQPVYERRRPGRYAPARERFAIALPEIPVAERRLVYRTYGPRPAARPTAMQASARAPASVARNPAPRAAAALRVGPRIRMEGGIRMIRGGGPN